MDTNNVKDVLKLIKSNDIFNSLKSYYFLEKVFNNLQKKKSLEIIKYNKKVQNRLNITIKEYKELYEQIEIEITPVMNKYGKYININEKDRIYYHIYFNNNKEEIKRNYLEQDHKVKKIDIIIDFQIISFKELFYFCECIESIYFKKFYRNNINNMSLMFCRCWLLKEINLSNFNTCNVTNMNGMFYECSLLKEINLSNFNTNNVTDMNGMFRGCSSLKEINLSNFNTYNVTKMNNMFYRCKSLTEINLSNLNTNNVIDMSYMFYGCSLLKKINLSNFNISNLINVYGMFSECSIEVKIQVRTQIKNINEDAFKY